MYLVYDAEGNLVHANMSDKLDLTGAQVYSSYDQELHTVIFYSGQNLPEYYDVDLVNKQIVEWDLQKKFNEGVYTPPEGFTVVDSEIVKIPSEEEPVANQLLDAQYNVCMMEILKVQATTEGFTDLVVDLDFKITAKRDLITQLTQ